MTDFHTAIISVGKIDDEELRLATARVAKLLRTPLEIRGKLPVPQGAHDSERGQFRASGVMKAARSMAPQLGSGALVGAEGDEQGKPPLKTDGYIFVTDVDLFTAKTDGVFGALVSAKGLALVSLRRIREAFYRRPADLGKQRVRLVKELQRMAGRLQGLPECTNPECPLAPSKSALDIDTKAEVYCRACSQRLFEGKIQV